MARRAMGLAKRRGGYIAGTPSKWRTLQDASTLASTDATTDASIDSTKLAAINLGGLLGRLRQTASNASNTVGNISTAARNVATGVPRPGDTLTPGTPAFNRLIPPIVQANNATVLPLRNPGMPADWRPSLTTTTPAHLQVPGMSEAVQRVNRLISAPALIAAVFGLSAPTEG